jgi:hypothetical protein
MYQRMTDYSLEELRQMAVGAGGMLCGGKTYDNNLPIGAILNEIGMIFLQGNQEAEQDLAKLFQDPDARVGSVAYFYLAQRRYVVEPGTRALIEVFEKNPANTKLVQRINEKIAELQS